MYCNHNKSMMQKIIVFTMSLSIAPLAYDAFPFPPTHHTGPNISIGDAGMKLLERLVVGWKRFSRLLHLEETRNMKETVLTDFFQRL